MLKAIPVNTYPIISRGIDDPKTISTVHQSITKQIPAMMQMLKKYVGMNLIGSVIMLILTLGRMLRIAISGK
jgi:hypothetical protein